MTTGESFTGREPDLDLMLRRVGEGDREAFATFFDTTYRTVESWMDASITADRHDDLLIEVYLRLWSTAPSFVAATTDVWRWLASIAGPLLVPSPDPAPPEDLQAQERAA